MRVFVQPTGRWLYLAVCAGTGRRTRARPRTATAAPTTSPPRRSSPSGPRATPSPKSGATQRRRPHRNTHARTASEARMRPQAAPTARERERMWSCAGSAACEPPYSRSGSG
eukprot:5140880-Prymnesium_polylepis.1